MTTSSLAHSSFSSILKSNQDELSKIEEFKRKPITTKIRDVVFTGIMVGTLSIFSLFVFQIISGFLAALVTITFGISAFLLGKSFRKQSRNKSMSLLATCINNKLEDFADDVNTNTNWESVFELEQNGEQTGWSYFPILNNP